MTLMAKAKPEVAPEYEPELHFEFSDNKKVPRGFDLLDVDSDVTVKVTGKVQSVRHDKQGTSFGMTFPKVKLSFPNSEPKSVADAMAESNEARKL
jgi:hypothetical protein